MTRGWASPFAIDPRSLALFRIGLAGLLLANLAYRAVDLEAHFTDAGVLPRIELHRFAQSGEPYLSLHTWSGGAPLQVFLFLTSAAFAIALGLGFHTRIATLASWLLLLSLHNRNPLVLTGGDELLRLMLFWSCFLPLGAVASLDARRLAPDVAPARPIVSVASAILLLQIALVYPISALFKLREPAWQSLDALSLALSVDGAATPLAQQLLAFPALMRALTWAALHFELFAFLLAFSPFYRDACRLLAVGLFVAYHLLGLSLAFRFGLFPAISAVGWLVFLPPRFWGRAAPGPEPPTSRADPWIAAVAAALGACVLVQNAATLGWIGGDARGPRGIVGTINRTLRLDQVWSLWSDPPSNRYFVAAAKTRSGRWIDLRRDGAPLDWNAPRLRSRNSHWWKLELSLTLPDLEPFRRGYGCYLLRDWNRRSAEADQVDSASGWVLLGTREEVADGKAARMPYWEIHLEECDRVYPDRSAQAARSKP